MAGIEKQLMEFLSHHLKVEVDLDTQVDEGFILDALIPFCEGNEKINTTNSKTLHR